MSALPRACVWVNPAAGGGRARAGYARLRPHLLARFSLNEIHVGSDAHAALARALREGTCLFIAAGGDGTLHSLVNALVELGAGRIPAGVKLGALGLGSSNDFHKPERARLEGIPVRLDVEHAAAHDLVRVRYRALDAPAAERHFVVSASLGITAFGNALFNRGDVVLRWLKSREPQLAIGYAVLRALLAYRSLDANLECAGERRQVRLFNLSVTKRAHVSGGLRYEGTTAADSGLVDVFLAADMCALRGTLAVLRLARGHFMGQPGTYHWAVSQLAVKLACIVDLELDGEIVRASEARFEVIAKGVVLCG